MAGAGLKAALRSLFGKFIVAMVFLTCSGVVFWLAMVHTLHLGTIAVPDLKSMTPEEASRTLHDVGLVIDVGETGTFSPSVEPGLIAEQDPIAGYHVKTGSVVKVLASLGSQRVVVPDLRGISLQAAQRDLEALGLTPGAQLRLHEHSVGDQIVATEPPANAEVAPGTEIKLLVNTTPKRELWVTPSFLSRSVTTVRNYCRRNHLRLGHVHEVSYPGISGGTVLRQYPPAGSPLSRSDIITVWASR